MAIVAGDGDSIRKIEVDLGRMLARINTLITRAQTFETVINRTKAKTSTLGTMAGAGAGTGGGLGPSVTTINTQTQAIQKQTQALTSSSAAAKTHLGVIDLAFKRAIVWGAVSAVIYKSVEAGLKFFDVMVRMDKQMQDLRKTLSGTEEDFKKLTDSAINIARAYKANTQDVLDAMEIFSKKFKSAAQLEELSKAAILFSNISGQTLKVSAETLTSTITQYDMAVSDAAKITDSWANVAANSAVSIKDLGDAVGEVGIAAKTAGLSFDELNGIIAAVVSGTGQSGTEVGNALKRIIERMSVPENAREIYKYGVAVFDSTGKVRNFMNILDDTNKVWGKLDDTARKNIAVSFAGARQYNSFLAIMNNYADVTKLVGVSQDSLGAAQKQNERISETFVKKVQQLGVEFDALARNVGSLVLPVLGSLVDLMRELIKFFNEGGTAVKLFGAALVGLAGLGAAKWIAGLLGITAGGAKALLGRVGGMVAGSLATAGASTGAATAGGIGVTATGALATGGIILAIVGLIAIFEKLRYKGEELAKAAEDLTSAGIQRSQTLFSLGKRARGLAGGSFTEEQATGIIKDIGKERPELIKDIYFDRFGNALDISTKKLLELAKAVENVADAEVSRSVTEGIGLDLQNIREEIIKLEAARGGPHAWEGSMKFAPGFEKLVNKTGRRQLSIEDIKQNQELFPGVQGLMNLGGDDAVKGTYGQMLDYTNSVLSLNEKSQNKINNILVKMRENGASNQVINKFLSDQESIGDYQFSNQYGKNLWSMFPLKGTKGASGDSRGAPRSRGKGFVPGDVTRIDLELNKSLVTSSRNFELFGGQVRVVEESIKAYEQALSDLANTTEKAAGPLEERAMKNEQIKLNTLQEELKELEKTGTVKQMNAKKTEIANLREKQSIQVINQERALGIALLKDNYKELKAISTLQDALRDPLKGAASNFLGNLQERISGTGELEAQRAFILQKIEREKLVQGNEGYAGTAKGRNALKGLNEELKALDKQQEALNKKTNVWLNMLNEIGSKLLNSVTGKFVDNIVESLGKTAGEAFGISGIMGVNPMNNALSANSIAVNSNTNAIIALTTSMNTQLGIGTGIGDFSSLEGQAAGYSAAQGTFASKQANRGMFAKASWSGALLAGIAGAGAGSAFTAGQNKQGSGGMIGGAIGGGVGSLGGPVLGIVGGIVGGLIGSLFDKPIEADIPQLDELEDSMDNLAITIEKSTKTLSETMENLINAPSSFMLPIAKGILSNSITAQSALAVPLQSGGSIVRGGLAYLHHGETVNPASQSNTSNITISPNITVNGGTANPQEIANEVIGQLNNIYNSQSARSGRYNRRF